VIQEFEFTFLAPRSRNNTASHTLCPQFTIVKASLLRSTLFVRVCGWFVWVGGCLSVSLFLHCKLWYILGSSYICAGLLMMNSSWTCEHAKVERNCIAKVASDPRHANTKVSRNPLNAWKMHKSSKLRKHPSCLLDWPPQSQSIAQAQIDPTSAYSDIPYMVSTDSKVVDAGGVNHPKIVGYAWLLLHAHPWSEHLKKAILLHAHPWSKHCAS